MLFDIPCTVNYSVKKLFCMCPYYSVCKHDFWTGQDYPLSIVDTMFMSYEKLWTMKHTYVSELNFGL